MSAIVKITKACMIGIHGTIQIAKMPKGKYLNVTLMAERLDSSKHHVAKVMQRLEKEGFIKSMRGPTGGFKLVWNPKDINFLSLYEAIEGRLTYNITKKDELLKSVTDKMTDLFVEYMKEKKVSDFVY